LAEHPEGIKASQIAKIIGIEKKIISSFLTHKQDVYMINDNWEWVPRLDPVIAKLNNREKAKKYTSKQFNSLTNWSICKAVDGTKKIGTYKTKTGNKIDYNSKYEPIMFKYLEDHNLVKEMGGQNLCIKYSSAFRDELSYYPDIVALTNDGYIMIIEVKPASMMSYHLNMEKYDRLAEYCEEHGYIYAMLDPTEDFMSYEEVRDMPVNPDLLDLFDDLVEQSKHSIVSFDKYDVDDWFDSINPGCTKKTFYLMVHSLIIFYDWYNKSKYDFDVISEPSSM
jgi:hypothetical protein